MDKFEALLQNRGDSNSLLNPQVESSSLLAEARTLAYVSDSPKSGLHRLNNIDKNSVWWGGAESLAGMVMIQAAAFKGLSPCVKLVPRASLEIVRAPKALPVTLGILGLAALGRAVYNYARFDKPS